MEKIFELIILLFLMFSCSGHGQESTNPLLGSGRGVDYMGILVKELEITCHDYEQILGFRCIKNPTGSYSGSLRSLITLGDEETLLEFLSPPKTNSAMNSEYLSYMRDFLSKYEGAMSLALETSSAKDAAEFLREKDFEVRFTEWPRETEENIPGKTPVQYTSVSISDTPSDNKKAFKLWIWLVEYSPGRSERLAVRREQGMMNHPNTAQRLHSVWFAVKDMDAVLRNLQDAGFEKGKACKMKLLGAEGREINAGKGSLLILQSAQGDGAIKKFLSRHEDGDIIGISIRVSDLNKARSWIEANSGNQFEPYDGLYGRSILIPPELTHGVWMELFQQ
jgi:catechol 2,3-dioxygenase-like lactoylglutathione lyase family enzyme